MSAAPVSLATLHWGPGTGPQVLLLHGITSSAGTWWQVASLLAEQGVSVTAADLRGHGSSPRSTDYALESYAADVLAVPRPASGAWDLVVGHSLGGAVTALALATDATWTRAALLVDPPLVIAAADVDDLVEGILADLEPPSVGELARQHPHWHVDDAFQKVQAAGVVSPFTVEATIRGNGARAGEWNLEALFGGSEAPVMILGADPAQGAMFSVEQGERIARLSDRVAYDIVAGAGHSIQRDAPGVVVEHALRLLPNRG
ncbi:alpha/beta fold hydrolase [Cnuibacter sp. UC19_7]|uniref:alpha/beta fold hydrolase n=1 Tax=Cnuibacter sp. UC19_7 TaxID=3350166 RepID=UPI00366D1219